MNAPLFMLGHLGCVLGGASDIIEEAAEGSFLLALPEWSLTVYTRMVSLSLTGLYSPVTQWQCTLDPFTNRHKQYSPLDSSWIFKDPLWFKFF